MLPLCQDKISPAVVEKINSAVRERLTGRPLWYILGSCDFYGYEFLVDERALIPRPETEELVDLIVQRHGHSPALRIWDLGTGSGCIAIALAKHLPQAEVFATDISEAALAIARENAEANQVAIHFARHDMLDAENLPFGDTHFDILVSNPPYIPAALRSTMHPNVVAHEPHSALFVPDDQPLLFYNALAEIGKCCLSPNGFIYAETFEEYHGDLNELFTRNGYTQFQSIADINGKKRMIHATR